MSNTIYEYYDQVSERYFVARAFNDNGKVRIKHLWHPLAKRIVVAGFDEFDLFIYRDGSCFVLCDGLTGSVLLRQCDLPSRIMRRAKLKLFTDCLPAELNRLGGKSKLNQVIINFLVDYDQEYSPRYQARDI